VIGILTGCVPQLNVITPPSKSAAANASSVQEIAVPVPTTVLGFEVSTESIGDVHIFFGRGQHKVVPITMSNKIVVETINDLPIIFSLKRKEKIDVYYEKI
jgi:hypothetical protein